MIRSVALAGGLVTVALVAVACANGGVTASASGQLAGSGSPTAVASDTPAPSASDGSAPPVSSVVPGGVSVDSALVGLLPIEVGGIRVTDDPATAAAIAADPDLATTASAIAVAYAIAPGASGDEDVAVASIVKLRPGVFGPAFFRSWRDSYDAAACEAAGGTSGNAQAEIAGRETYIGTCAAGAHTYHVYLEDSDVIVSVTSVGAGRFGEQIVAGLRE